MYGAVASYIAIYVWFLYLYVIYVQIASIFCLCYQFYQQSTKLILP